MGLKRYVCLTKLQISLKRRRVSEIRPECVLATALSHAWVSPRLRVRALSLWVVTPWVGSLWVVTPWVVAPWVVAFRAVTFGIGSLSAPSLLALSLSAPSLLVLSLRTVTG